MNTIEAIRTRMSYRGLYKPDPVSREKLEIILEAGLAAPSGCNKQTTSLIAVDDPALIEKLKALIDPPICETAPAMICVLTKRIAAYRDVCFAAQDYAAAIENMLLSAVELGLSSCWIEGHITDVDQIGRKMADVLGVPQEYELVCFLPLGIAAEPARRVKKKPSDQRAWFNGFQKSDVSAT